MATERQREFSLKPLIFNEAVTDLLKVPPPPKAKPKRKKADTKGKPRKPAKA